MTDTAEYIEDGRPHVLQDKDVPHKVSLRIHGPFLFSATDLLVEKTADLSKFAPIVILRLRNMTAPGRPISPQSMLLAAISLAHDLEEEKRKRAQLEARSKEMLRGVLARIDAAIEASDEKADGDGDPSEPPPPLDMLSDEFEL